MEKTLKKSTQLALAGAFLTAVGMVGSTAPVQAADDFEKCYGISLKAQNDCASEGNNSCAGTSTADYDPVAWKLVKKGTCTATEVKLPDGTARMGSLEPISG